MKGAFQFPDILSIADGCTRIKRAGKAALRFKASGNLYLSL
jgi:hypothetical protein